jgi:penicillin G amidase
MHIAQIRLQASCRAVPAIALWACTLFFAICASAAPARPTTKDAVSTETTSVAGLRQPAEILIDHWGVPHIYARNESDLFFAQGFNAARDRLFQIDLWRRRGLGQLAEVFGPAYIEQDRATRLFLYRGDMKRE